MDFWEKLKNGSSVSSYTSTMDQHLNGQTFTSLQELTDNYREKSALKLPVQVGTRVAFMGWLESYLSYDNPPQDKALGTVVSAKSANGVVTSLNDKVFVKFDNGQLMSVFASHLKTVAEDTSAPTQEKFVTKSASDLDNFLRGEFLKVGDNHLVHKSTEDLWSFQKDADGNITVEKLYDDNGNPLKV